MGLLSESECFEIIIDLLYTENQIWSADYKIDRDLAVIQNQP